MAKAKNQAKVNILCIDGHRQGHDTVTLILELNDYCVTNAHSEEEALRQARTNQFDLYILDSWPPNGAEFDLCRQIRTFDPTTPLIFYSTRDEEQGQRAALAAGGQGHIRKPTYSKRLIRFINDVLSKPVRAEREPRREPPTPTV
jgi:two-component system, NarL family, response regulator DevR